MKRHFAPRDNRHPKKQVDSMVLKLEVMLHSISIPRSVLNPQKTRHIWH
jgi:hypothetical protein